MLDLVAVLDADGEGIGTQDYRYSQRVIVIGIAASEQWTSTEAGIRIGGAEGFDMEYLMGCLQEDEATVWTHDRLLPNMKKRRILALHPDWHSHEYLEIRTQINYVKCAWVLKPSFRVFYYIVYTHLF